MYGDLDTVVCQDICVPDTILALSLTADLCLDFTEIREKFSVNAQLVDSDDCVLDEKLIFETTQDRTQSRSLGNAFEREIRFSRFPKATKFCFHFQKTNTGQNVIMNIDNVSLVSYCPLISEPEIIRPAVSNFCRIIETGLVETQSSNSEGCFNSNSYYPDTHGFHYDNECVPDCMSNHQVDQLQYEIFTRYENGCLQYCLAVSNKATKAELYLYKGDMEIIEDYYCDDAVSKLSGGGTCNGWYRETNVRRKYLHPCYTTYCVKAKVADLKRHYETIITDDFQQQLHGKVYRRSYFLQEEDQFGSEIYNVGTPYGFILNSEIECTGTVDFVPNESFFFLERTLVQSTVAGFYSSASSHQFCHIGKIEFETLVSAPDVIESICVKTVEGKGTAAISENADLKKCYQGSDDCMQHWTVDIYPLENTCQIDVILEFEFVRKSRTDAHAEVESLTKQMSYKSANWCATIKTLDVPEIRTEVNVYGNELTCESRTDTINALSSNNFELCVTSDRRLNTDEMDIRTFTVVMDCAGHRRQRTFISNGKTTVRDNCDVEVKSAQKKICGGETDTNSNSQVHLSEGCFEKADDGCKYRVVALMNSHRGRNLVNTVGAENGESVTSDGKTPDTVVVDEGSASVISEGDKDTKGDDDVTENNSAQGFSNRNTLIFIFAWVFVLM